jgi:hypothetical protein
MSDNLSKRGKADRARISLAEQWEVDYECDKLGCTERELRDAVAEVGPMRKKVEAHLEQEKERAAEAARSGGRHEI